MLKISKFLLTIDTVSKLESLLQQYRAYQKTFEQQIKNVLISIEEGSDGYDDLVKNYMSDLDEISNTRSTYEDKIKYFHPALSTDATRKSLISSGILLDTLFRVENPTSKPSAKIKDTNAATKSVIR